MPRLGIAAGVPSWAPPAPPPPFRGPARRGPALVLGAAFAAVVLVAGVAAFVILRGGRDYPKRWDPRVADLVDFVELERDLHFDHPVEVEFLSEEEFRSTITTAESDLTDEDRAEMDRMVGFLRAVGLVEGELDLLDTMNTTAGEGTLAYYSYEEKRIVVRGTELDLAARATLVHELTHALQDQHFDLADRFDEAGSSMAYTGLVEGDADLIEAAWVDELSEVDRDEYERLRQEESQAADFGDIPDIFPAMLSLPYELGPALVTTLREEDGSDLDDAFRRADASEEHLLSPLTSSDGDTADPVDRPDLETDEREVAGGDDADGDDADETMGAIGWFIVLAERLDPHEALAAADGWGGDSMVDFERDGVTCVRASFSGESADDSDRMRAALKEWVTLMPEGAAEIGGEQLVTLTSCDPGPDAGSATGRAADALVLPAARSGLYLSMVEEGVPTEAAWCFARQVVADSTVEQLSDPEGSYFTSDEFRRRAAEFAADCRLG